MTHRDTHQTSNTNSGDQPGRITLSAPTENQHLRVAVSQGLEIMADFDLGSVIVENSGLHILLRFPENGTITLENITTLMEDDASPVIILQDGSVLSASQILASIQAPEIEVAPAAGKSGLNSGGVSEYEDNPGSILDGVERLDGLDFSQVQGISPPDIDDFGGNSDAPQAAGNTNIDTIPPAFVINEIGNTNDSTPTINGTAEPGSTIIIEAGGVTMTTTTDEVGHWSVSIPDATPLSDGAYVITGSATDASGNYTTGTAHLAVDTTAYANISLDADITPDDVITSAEEGGDITISGTVSGDAQDGDVVTLTVNGQTYTGAVDNGTFKIDVPGSELAADPDQRVDVAVTATDSLGNTVISTDSETYGVNHTPNGEMDGASGLEDSPITGNVLSNDSDSDGDSLSVDPTSVGKFPTSEGGTIEISSDGSYTYTPAPNFNGTDSLEYTVTDGQLTDTATLTITVGAVNDAPVAVNDETTTSEDTPVSSRLNLQSNDSDPEGDSLSVDATSVGKFPTSEGGTIEISSDGSYIYTPAPNFNGTDSFEYTVTDGQLSDTATLTITVGAVNDAPVAVNDETTTSEDTPVSARLNLQSNDSDADGDSLSVDTTSVGKFPTSEGGTIEISADGSYTYTPAPNFNGTDSFEYTVTDGQLTDTATLTITVGAVNDAPVAVNDETATSEDTPVSSSLNLQSNDSDADGDSLSVDTTSVGKFPTSEGGTIEISADGSYTYTPAPNFNGTDSFEYTVTDGQLTDTGTLTINVDAVNDAPEVRPESVNISEEGLSGGIPDDAGTDDHTDLASHSGRVSISDMDGDTIESVTLTAPDNPLTSNGETINWSGEGTSTLTGKVGDQPVLEITIDQHGEYTLDLKAPIDHMQSGEDAQTLEIGVTASDGTVSTTGTLAIQLEDDSPVAGNTVNSITVPETDTNVMIMLDVSGSMNWKSGVDNMSRMALAKQAIGELLDSYDGYGDVSVQIVTFGNDSKILSDTWVSVEQAKALLEGVRAGGMTNYDAALNTVRLEAFDTAGKIDGAQNVSYFISDGRPNRPSGSAGIDDHTEEPLWTQFLDDNQIDSYALGMGTRVPQSAMDPIAYDGIFHSNTQATVVEDLSQLSSVLLNTVAPPTVGELMNGDPLSTGSAIGADDGFLHALTVDGNTYVYSPEADSVRVSGVGPETYTFDPTTDLLNITTDNGGLLTVNLETGSYTYRAPADLSDAITEHITYTLRDYDGDTADGQLTLAVSRDHGTVVELSGTDSADVINGTATQDLIDGNDGDDLLYGRDGHDTLSGDTGNDILVGGDGDDLLIGGLGDDTLIGGDGGNTYAFSANGGEGTDTITDFDVATDVIRLTDVLDVEGQGDGIDISDLLKDGGQDVTANVTGADVELTISNGSQSTVVTLTGINANHDFTGDTTLQQLIDHGLNVDPM